MAGEGSLNLMAPSHHLLLRNIKTFVRSLVVDLANGRSPSVALDRFKNYCSNPSAICTCSSDLPCGQEIISLEKESHAYRVAVMLRVLLIIQQLLQENRHVSKRDIYYMQPSFFQGQAVVDRAINDTCILLKCSRHNLNVVPVGKGFLRHVAEQLHLPVFCLVDADPYGFDILTTYRFGSMQMAYDAKLMRVPEIRWLGAFPSEFEKYHLPDRCLLQLTPEDKKKAQAMMLRCYLHQEAPQWRSELEIMLQKGVKFEIEALSVFSLSFLSEEYLPAKIQHGAYI